MKKIEAINLLVKKLDLTAEDVVKNWIAQGILDSTVFTKEEKTSVQKPFEGINFVPSKKFVTPKNIKPGMFYYADGLIYPKLIKDNQVSAIVASVEKNHGLAMGLREAVLPWSDDLLYVGLPVNICGKEATKRILDAAQRKGKSAEAAEWCAAYAYDGIEAGTMFMPSRTESEKVLANCERMENSFFQIMVNIKRIWSREDETICISKKQTYWSASEASNRSLAWGTLCCDDIVSEKNFKSHYHAVRCVLDFKL